MAYEHLDVVIVGAGISGIGAAHYLQAAHPRRSFAILEARDALGGTWDLFRYPGIRSDSDLYTFGYEFKPWTADEAIASGPAILDYLHEVVDEDGIGERIRYGHRVVQVSWSTLDMRWTVDIEHVLGGERSQVTCDWLFVATGYYRYDEGFTPDFAGREDFRGVIVHPQQWPDDLDYAGKKVVVIGSGATAVTLVPAMAEAAEHVTMLQRTPTYVMPIPTRDSVAILLRRALGPQRAHGIVRRKNIARQRIFWSLSRKHPDRIRALIRWVNTRQLPDGYPVDEHFNPPYDPWDQRLCAVPDGDLFTSISNGSASVVTDRIVRFTPDGILLESGRELKADVVVTATGLNVIVFGGVPVVVDGRHVEPSSTVAYKGMMLSGVPNLAFSIGYTNSSWTLKVGLLCRHFCQLLDYMDARGFAMCTPTPSDAAMATRPFLDFGAGYIRRVIDRLPRQGDRWPWLTSLDYRNDVRLLRADRIVDPELRFRRRGDVSTSEGVEHERV